VSVELARQDGPDLAQVAFAVFGKETGKAGFFEQATSRQWIAVFVIARGVVVPRLDFPVVNFVVVPWFVPSIFVVVLFGLFLV